MKYCEKCGNQLLDEAVICPKCGCAVGKSKSPKKKDGNTAGNAVAIVLVVIGGVVALGSLIFLLGGMM